MSVGPATQAAAAQPVPPEEPKFLGVTIGDVAKVILGGLLTLVVLWWTTKVPHLTVRVADPIQFNGDKNQFGIQNVTIVNDGSMEAENVDCEFSLTDCKIQEVKVLPDNVSLR